jgi:deoxyribose-phosphate aldolase
LPDIVTIPFDSLARLCDHTYLDRPEGYRARGSADSYRDRAEALVSFVHSTLESRLQPYALCVRPEDVRHVKRILEEERRELVVVSVVGFPDGSWYSTDFKVAEARLALSAGADEMDMVLHTEYLKAGALEHVRNDITPVVSEAHSYDAKVKLILEVSELSPQQIITSCTLARECGVDFVKTSTGFASAGADEASVRLMREHFDGGIKISGGVTLRNVYPLLRACAGDGSELALDPRKVRIGESRLLSMLVDEFSSNLSERR